MLKGLGVSDGLGFGRILHVKPQERKIPTDVLPPEAELERFNNIYQRALSNTYGLLEKARRQHKENLADIIDAHLTILEDEYSLVEPVQELIRNGQLNAFQAVDCQLNLIFEEMSNSRSELMRARAADILDIKNEILDIGLGIQRVDLSDLEQDTILVAEELTPSQTVGLDAAHVSAIVVTSGSATSHIAIISRAMGIPTVVNIQNIFEVLPEGQTLIVDADTGELTLSPTPEEITQYKIKRAHLDQLRTQYESYRNCGSRTADGTVCQVFANIATPENAALAIQGGAEGIGLFRSEFLYMNRTALPSEEEQYRAYRSVADQFGDREVIIRTMDIGGDKTVPALPIEPEDNPFLGYRAIRICIDHPDLFKTQLRAIFRAAYHRKIKIMFPMVSSIQELRRGKEIAEEVKQELAAAQVEFNPNVPIGIMIEIPAAAVMAECFAKEAAFFSIGTNDLIQYTIAADRGNAKVSALYSAYQPAVLHLIDHAIRAAHQEKIPCGMCGEAAADRSLVPVWIGMGLDEFSVSPNLVLQTRATISALTRKDCERLTQQVLEQSNSGDIYDLLHSDI